MRILNQLVNLVYMYIYYIVKNCYKPEKYLHAVHVKKTCYMYMQIQLGMLQIYC